MTDSAIIDLFFARDEGALRELDEKYGRQMKKYASKCLTDDRDAEEACNDTLVDIWNSIPPEHPKRLEAFVMAVLKHRVLNKIQYVSREKRKRSRETLFADFEFVDANNGFEDEIVEAKSGAVDRFISKQPAQNRIIFVKRYYFGRSVAEVAKEMGMTENAVSIRLSRLREKLRKYLKEEEGLLR